MNWRPIEKLYNQGEFTPQYPDANNRVRKAKAYAVTELYVDPYHGTASKCNIAIQLENGHIIVDD